jgi:hypothetical protein
MRDRPVAEASTCTTQNTQKSPTGLINLQLASNMLPAIQWYIACVDMCAAQPGQNAVARLETHVAWLINSVKMC